MSGPLQQLVVSGREQVLKVLKHYNVLQEAEYLPVALDRVPEQASQLAIYYNNPENTVSAYVRFGFTVPHKQYLFGSGSGNDLKQSAKHALELQLWEEVTSIEKTLALCVDIKELYTLLDTTTTE